MSFQMASWFAATLLFSGKNRTTGSHFIEDLLTFGVVLYESRYVAD